jgi:DNA-binding MarR family transcriptional regulator
MAEDPTQECAATIMDTFHLMMRSVGGEARRRSPTEFSMQQFRAMMAIEHHKGVSLSQVAEHLGSTLSAVSKLIDSLVERGYVRRETAEDDRRRLILALTDNGEQTVRAVKMHTVSCLAEKLASLTSGECAILNLAMDLLCSAISAPQAAQSRQTITQQGEQSL